MSPQPRAGLPLCHGSLVLRVSRRKRNHESRRDDRRGRSHRPCASSDHRCTLSAVRRTAQGHLRIEHSRRHVRTRPAAASSSGRLASRDTGSRRADCTARPGDPDIVRFRVDPDGASAVITAAYEGFEVSFDVGEGGVLPTVESIVGQPPQEIRIFDWGRFADSVDGATISRPPYRERVF